MTMVCSICNDPNRLEIDRELVQGRSIAVIAREYQVSENSLHGHKENHLSRQLVQAFQKKELAESMGLMTKIENIISRAEKIFRRNYVLKKDALALKALGEQRSTIELLAKIAAYWHELRAQELQSQQGDYESRRKAEIQENAKRACDRLNDAEFNLFCKLLAKIEGETEKEIIPYQEIVWPEYIPGEAADPEPEQEFDEPAQPQIKRTTKNPLSVQPIEPEKLQPYSEKPVGTGHWPITKRKA